MRLFLFAVFGVYLNYPGSLLAQQSWMQFGCDKSIYANISVGSASCPATNQSQSGMRYYVSESSLSGLLRIVPSELEAYRELRNAREMLFGAQDDSDDFQSPYGILFRFNNDASGPQDCKLYVVQTLKGVRNVVANLEMGSKCINNLMYLAHFAADYFKLVDTVYLDQIGPTIREFAQISGDTDLERTTTSYLPFTEESETIQLAGSVSLRSSDGAIDVTGELVGFDGETYILRTQLGNLRISASRVSCDGVGCPPFSIDADVRFAGSDAVSLGLMPLLIEGYSNQLGAFADFDVTQEGKLTEARFIADAGFGNEVVSFLLEASDSSDAFRSLLDQSADIGMTSRRIRPDEAHLLRESGAGNMLDPRQEQVIALDGAVAIVHPANQVSPITNAQLLDVYTGQIQNWSELGGADLPISVVGHRQGSGIRDTLEQFLFGGGKYNIASDARIVDSNADAVNAVLQDQTAISFVSFAFQGEAKPLTLIDECGISMSPDVFSIQTEEYPLSKRVYLYSRADSLDVAAEEFLDFAASVKADGLVSKAGFVDLDVVRREQTPNDGSEILLGSDSDRLIAMELMQDMSEQLDGYDRLSTTFRFRTGSSQLDERGRADMLRLTNYLIGQPRGTEILVVGFTDDEGEIVANQQLAEFRAAQIREEIATAGSGLFDNINISSVGFGEISPRACNTSDRGRSTNRRVEVWIRSPS